MENPIWLNRTMIDVVFEGRHKAYGAFILRRNYEKNMALAMLIAISLFLVTINMPTILRNLKGEENTTTVFNIPPPVILETPDKPAIKPPVKTEINSTPKPPKPEIQYIAPTVVQENNEPEELPPTQSELASNIIGTTNVEGDSTGMDPGLIEGSVSNGVMEVIEDDSEKEPIPNYAVQQKPEFPGGEKALGKFITDHLHIPPDEMSGQLNILLQFVIDPEGHVRDIKVVRSSTKRLDQRAMDVVRNMPLWKPGKQNGRPVGVIMLLPIRIQYQ